MAEAAAGEASVSLRIWCRDAAVRALVAHLRTCLPEQSAGHDRTIVISDRASDSGNDTIAVVDPRQAATAHWLSAAIREDRLGGAVAIDRIERDLPVVIAAVKAGVRAFSPGLLANLSLASMLTQR